VLGAAFLELAVGTGAALFVFAAGEGVVSFVLAGWGIEFQCVSSVLFFESKPLRLRPCQVNRSKGFWYPSSLSAV
jgi:hypothetical protein